MCPANDLKIDGTGGQDVFVGPQGNRRRNFVVAGLGVGVLVLAGFSFTFVSDFLRADDYFELAKVRTAAVKQGRFERSISVEGNVVATFNPTLYAQDMGVVTLLVEEGTTVSRDEPLAAIDNPELVSQLKRQQAALELQEVELDTLGNQLQQRELESVQALTLLKINLEAERRELERMTKIVSEGSISINDYEKLKDRVHAFEVQVRNTALQNQLTEKNHVFELRTKELSIDQQKLLVDDLQRQVDALHLVAPVDGVVGDIQVNERDTVTRNQPILNVVDLSSYQVEVLIPETYAESLQLGLSVLITYRNQEHPGSLISISPEVQAGSVTARVEFGGQAPPGLRQNLRLNNKIILEARDNVIKTKRGPFVEAHGGRGVYVVDGDLAHFRRIEIGSTGINEVEIVSGVKVGEELIISNTAELMGAETVLITN